MTASRQSRLQATFLVLFHTEGYPLCRHARLHPVRAIVARSRHPKGAPAKEEKEKGVSCWFSFGSGKSFDEKIAEQNRASGIVFLKGEGAFAKFSFKGSSCLPIVRLGPFDNGFSVYFGHDLLAFHLNVNLEPLVVSGGGFQGVFYTVDTGRFLGVVIGVVDLAFEARLWPALVLKAGMKIDSGVGMRQGHDLGLEFEILEGLGGLVEEVAPTGRVGHDASVLYREGYVVLVCFPSLESLAVEHTDPALAGGMILGQMFAQQVATEIAVEVPPDRMDVIGVVLRGIVFEEKLRGLNPCSSDLRPPVGSPSKRNRSARDRGGGCGP